MIASLGDLSLGFSHDPAQAPFIFSELLHMYIFFKFA